MKDEVLIYLSKELVSLEVVMPSRHAADFIVQFGEEFSQESIERDQVIKKVDDYFFHPSGWHIIVSIQKKQTHKFYKFLRQFSKDKHLSFRSHN